MDSAYCNNINNNNNNNNSTLHEEYDELSLEKLKNILLDDSEVSSALLTRTLVIALSKSLDETSKLREDVDALQSRVLENEIENVRRKEKFDRDFVQLQGSQSENEGLIQTLGAGLDSQRLEHDKLVKKVDLIDRDLMDTQQYIRRWTIEIKGVPEHIDQSDLKNWVIHQVLERTCGYKIYPRDVEACHRLGKRNSKSNEPLRVVARLVNREDAENAIRGRHKLRSFPHLRRIFIIDNLCPRYREIFDDLSDLKSSGIINQVWTYNGKVHYKTTNKRRGQGKRVSHMDDIEHLKDSARLLEMERQAQRDLELSHRRFSPGISADTIKNAPVTRSAAITPVSEQTAPNVPSVPLVNSIAVSTELEAVLSKEQSSSISSSDLRDLPDLEESFESAPNIKDVLSEPDARSEPVLTSITISPEPVIVSVEVGDLREPELDPQVASPEPELTHDESSSNTIVVTVPEVHLSQERYSPTQSVVGTLHTSPEPEVAHKFENDMVRQEDGGEPAIDSVPGRSPTQQTAGLEIEVVTDLEVHTSNDQTSPTQSVTDPEVHSSEDPSTQFVVPEILHIVDESSGSAPKVEVAPSNPDLSSESVGLPKTVPSESEVDCSIEQSSVSVSSSGNLGNTPVPEELSLSESTTPSISSVIQLRSDEVPSGEIPDSAVVSFAPPVSPYRAKEHLDVSPESKEVHVTSDDAVIEVRTNENANVGISVPVIECPLFAVVLDDDSLINQSVNKDTINSPTSSNATVESPSTVFEPVSLVNLAKTKVVYNSPEPASDEIIDPVVSATVQPLNAGPSLQVNMVGHDLSLSTAPVKPDVDPAVSDDDVFDGPDVLAQPQTSPTQEINDRFYSCSASIDGLQLKLRRHTVSILNELCKSLESSPSESLSKPSTCNQVVSEATLMSESQLSHAGFFNNNDSVPNVEIKLSRCNSYSLLLTDSDSNG